MTNCHVLNKSILINSCYKNCVLMLFIRVFSYVLKNKHNYEINVYMLVLKNKHENTI